ncbi:hypothetical protein F4805DRAFT_85408 [Annulohypoxylon moriforme]|nr:hypothetical protein F4805DRAFT_85408 [Annulohypoxylon moriforme]
MPRYLDNLRFAMTVRSNCAIHVLKGNGRHLFRPSRHWWPNISAIFVTTIIISGLVGFHRPRQAGGSIMEDEALQLKPNESTRTVHCTLYTVQDTRYTIHDTPLQIRHRGGSAGPFPANMDLHGWERICTKGGKSLKGGGCAYVQWVAQAYLSIRQAEGGTRNLVR